MRRLFAVEIIVGLILPAKNFADNFSKNFKLYLDCYLIVTDLPEF